MAPRSGKTRTSKPSPADLQPVKPAGATAKVYRIPYFQHQQLDPEYWDYEYGKPLGPSPTGLFGRRDGSLALWDCDEDGTADSESESEDANPLFLSERKKGSKRPTAAAREDSPAVRRRRVTDGRPAVAKRVTADLDSDDELIVRMKEARYLEKDIAEKLAEQGRIRYNPKTIGTRWRRIKSVLQKRNDALLDAELTDWHEGDDDVLDQAIEHADTEVARLVAEIEARKWRIVSDKMKCIKPVTNFSQHACRKRHEERLAGTAKPTPESISNPSPQVLERIESRKIKEQNLVVEQASEVMQRANIEGNGWTSKQRHYF